MIGAIAGQGGFDSKGKTQNIVFGTTTGTSYVSVLDITGSGYLMSAILAGHEYPCLKIVIDGITKVDANLAYSSYGVEVSITPIFRFNSSLQVQIKNNTSGKPAWSTVAYLLD